jgi:hypothetical protein
MPVSTVVATKYEGAVYYRQARILNGSLPPRWPLTNLDGLRRLKPSHKGGPPQTVVRGGTCVNRRG